MKIYLDTETIGLPSMFKEDDKLCNQLAYMIEDENSSSIYSTYCRPELYKQSSISAMAINHITPEFLEDKPLLQNTKEYKLLNSLTQDKNIFIAHNSPFDKSILEREGIDFKDSYFIDTLKIAKFINDNQQIYDALNLQHLKYHYRLDLLKPALEEELKIYKKLKAHDAVSDVLDLVLLYKQFQKEFNMTDAEAIDISSKPLFLKYVPWGIHKGKLFTSLSYGSLNWFCSSDDEDVVYTANRLINN